MINLEISVHQSQLSKRKQETVSHAPEWTKIFSVGNLILNDSTSITIWLADINIDVDDIEV